MQGCLLDLCLRLRLCMGLGALWSSLSLTSVLRLV